MSLFGNLFDEGGGDADDEDESANELIEKDAGSSVGVSVRDGEKPDLTEPVKPPAVRPEHGLCGILNRGATCYLNSLLQVILLCTRCLRGPYKTHNHRSAVVYH